MKMTRFSTFFLSLLLTAAVLTTANAQYDDVYFDPNRDAPYTSSKGSRYARTADNASSSAYNYSQGYDDSSYDFGRDTYAAQADQEYDYYYTSRIRRFNQPYYGFGFFDPIYVDMGYYDPFFNPAATVLIYDNFYSYSAFNSWNRWNRWNRFNTFAGWGWTPYTPFYSSWGWNRFNGGGFNSFNSWDPWYGPSFANNFAVNNFYGVGGGFVSNLYCPPAWGGGVSYNTVNSINNNFANPNGTYFGPRSTGATQTPVNSRTRIQSLETPREANTGLDRVRTSPTSLTTEREAVRTRTTDGAVRPVETREQPTRTTTPSYERARSRNEDVRTTSPTPTREATPARSYDRSRTTTPAPSRTYDRARDNTPAPARTAPAPRREAPAPTRSYDTPTRSSTPAPSRNYNSSPSRSTTPATRSYDSPSRSSSPSYNAPSRSSSPSYSPSRSSSPSSAPSRSSGTTSSPRSRGN